MERRQLLKGLGGTAFLATFGVHATAYEPDASGDHEGFQRSVDVTAADELAASVPVDFSVQAVQSRITDRQTAIFEVTTTNRSEETLRLNQLFYKEWPSEGGDEGVLLVDPNGVGMPSTDYSPNCSEDPAGLASPTSTYEGPGTHELAPGEAVTDELLLANQTTVEGCFEPGEYRYESTTTVRTAPSPDDERVLKWGFDISITNG